MDTRKLFLWAVLGGAVSTVPVLANADPYRLVIKNHRYEPTELLVPAGKRVKLIVDNQDNTPEEFESYSLNREKIVPGSARVVVYIGPLEPGRYKFFGDFHQDTAQGSVVAK